MYASIVTGLFDRTRRSESVRLWEMLRKDCGASRGYLLVEAETSEWISVDLWETEEDARRIEKKGNSQNRSRWEKESAYRI